MATHSSVLAWRIPGIGEPGWAAAYGVTQSQTRLKRLSSSSIQLKFILFIPSFWFLLQLDHIYSELLTGLVCLLLYFLTGSQYSHPLTQVSIPTKKTKPRPFLSFSCGYTPRALRPAAPNSLAPGTGFVEDSFSTDEEQGGREGFRMIQMHYIYCSFYFYYYYISSTSDHWVLDPRSWAPLTQTMKARFLPSQ